MRPSLFVPFGRAIALCGALSAGACMQQADHSHATANTQTAVGQRVPGPGSDTLGTTLGSVVAGDPNSGLSAGGRSPVAPAIAHVAAALSISPGSAPDLCLAVSSGYTAVALVSCSDDAAEKWVYVNGLLQGAGGACLAVDPNLNNAAVLSPCDGNDSRQQMLRVGGSLSAVAMSGSLRLQINAVPATTTTLVSFAPFDAALAAQQAWSLVQRSHDKNGAVVTKGVSATVLEAGGTCFAATPEPSYVPCAADDANQRWLLLDDGLMRNERSNLCLGLVGTNPTMLGCDKGPATFWGTQSGVVFNANSTCLDGNDPSAATPVLKLCNFATSRHFIFGLSKGL